MSHFAGKSVIGSLALGAVVFLTAPATSLAAANATLMIGNFEQAKIQHQNSQSFIPSGSAESGWGWSTSTDSFMGGHSVVSIELVHPGADGGKTALRILGEIKSGYKQPWAGAFWFAGSQPMQPVDLSGKTVLSFWARGTAGTYRVMLLSGAGYVPQSTSFKLTGQWREYHIELTKAFPGADFKQVKYLGFSASQTGKFQLDLDSVSLGQKH